MELLKNMCHAYGTSCHEDELKSIVYNEINELVDEIYVDNLGNLIAHKKGDGIKLAFSAFLDQEGVFCTVNENGKQRFGKIGETDLKELNNKNIILENGLVFNIKSDSEEDLDIRDFYFESDEDLSGMTGCFFDENFVESEEDVKSISLTTKLPAYFLVTLIKSIKNSYYDLYFCFTVQKQIGFKGAKTVLNDIHPDFLINIDCVNANEKGFIILCKDKQYLANQTLKNIIIYLANKSEIPFSLCLADIVTQTSKLINSGDGTKGICLGVPIFNKKICKKADILALNKILLEIIGSDNL